MYWGFGPLMMIMVKVLCGAMMFFIDARDDGWPQRPI